MGLDESDDIVDLIVTPFASKANPHQLGIYAGLIAEPVLKLVGGFVVTLVTFQELIFWLNTNAL